MLRYYEVFSNKINSPLSYGFILETDFGCLELETEFLYENLNDFKLCMKGFFKSAGCDGIVFIELENRLKLPDILNKKSIYIDNRPEVDW